MSNPTTDFVMTCYGPRSLDYIEAHARNELSVNPGSVNANDKFLLVQEIRRLRAELKTLHCLDVTAREGQRAFNEWRDRSVNHHGR